MISILLTPLLFLGTLVKSHIQSICSYFMLNTTSTRVDRITPYPMLFRFNVNSLLLLRLSFSFLKINILIDTMPFWILLSFYNTLATVNVWWKLFVVKMYLMLSYSAIMFTFLCSTYLMCYSPLGLSHNSRLPFIYYSLT